MFGHGRKLGNTDKEQSPVILLSGDADGEGNGDGDDEDNGGKPTMVTGQKPAVVQSGLNSGRYQGGPDRSRFLRNQNRSQRRLRLVLGKELGEIAERGCHRTAWLRPLLSLCLPIRRCANNTTCSGG